MRVAVSAPPSPLAKLTKTRKPFSVKLLAGKEVIMQIKDSGGERRKFASGAVRDIDENKGRCDLLPLGVLAECTNDPILGKIERYVRTGERTSLEEAILIFAKIVYKDVYTALLEVSIHYREGCIKYSERNWEKGIPLHSYIDSGVRHYLKYRRGDKDEPHDRAFLWNLLGALWTHKNLPEFIDLPFRKETA